MDHVTTATTGPPEVIRTAARIAAFLSSLLAEEITPAQVWYWGSVGKIRLRKFGNNIVASPDELREDMRGASTGDTELTRKFTA